MLRRNRITESLGIRLPAVAAADPRPWHAVVMSRVGRSPLARRVELATLYRWTEQAIARGEVPISAAGTAAYPWVRRACELMGTAVAELDLGGELDGAETLSPRTRSGEMASAGVQKISLASRPGAGHTPSRDELAVMLADRVDVAWVRPSGTIFRLVLQRLGEEPPAGVRVLIPSLHTGQVVNRAAQRAAQQLIARGAIGFCWQRDERSELSGGSRDDPLEPLAGGGEASLASHVSGEAKATASAAMAALLEHPQRWLIHCTRARSGAWPGQSEQQFRDGLLLTPPHADDLSPLATLKRIVAQRQLVGTSRSFKGSQTAVCFSAEPLLDVVGRRCFRSHLGRWDAEPYGLAIDLDAARRLGAQEVIYSRPGDALQLPAHQAWRRQAAGATYDWTAEREWRIRSAVDLRQLGHHQVIVFVDREDQLNQLPQMPWSAVSIESLQRAQRLRCDSPAV